jgi:SAM-dependent methyltransferase
MKFTGERVVPYDMHTHPHVYQEHLARYVFALGFVDKTKRVLDAACGTGYGTELLSSLCDYAVGIDSDPESVDHAMDHYMRMNSDYVLVDIENPPNEATFMQGLSSRRMRSETPSFDVIVSFETVEHVDPDKYFAFVKTNLAQGGTLILSTPINPNRNPRNSFHKFEWDAAEFKAALEAHFADIEYYRQDGINIVKADDLETASYGIAVCSGINSPSA